MLAYLRELDESSDASEDNKDGEGSEEEGYQYCECFLVSLLSHVQYNIVLHFLSSGPFGYCGSCKKNEDVESLYMQAVHVIILPDVMIWNRLRLAP